jgi:hypothetical protein
MNRFSWFVGGLTLVVAVTFAQDAQPSDGSPASPSTTAPVAPAAKSPIPDTAAQKKAGTLVNEVYGKDISKAKTTEAKAALAKKLLQSGIDEQGDLSTRWVLFDLAVDLAVQAADTETVFAATDELVKWFAVDALKWKADTLAKLERVKGADASVLAEHFVRLIDEAIVADRYDVAKQVAELAVVVTRKSGDSGVVQAATARLQEVKTIEAGHEQAQKAQATLATDSNNTAAYLTAGRFLCFLKGDWEKGVPMLANSSDKALKAVADMEVAKPAEPARQVELADGWWELAKKEQGLSQRNLRSHAAEWYKKALPSLTGVLKLKAGIRLEEIERTAENSSLWMVLFRSDDPSIWNKNVNEGTNRFAVALSRVPDNIRFLRMTCAGKSVIIPISKSQIATTDRGANAVGWAGRGLLYDGGIHVGIYSNAYVAGPGSAVILFGGTEYSGWGFGHKHSGHVAAYAWEGRGIGRTVFEIAVAPSITPEEAKRLLTDKGTHKGK